MNGIQILAAAWLAAGFQSAQSQVPGAPPAARAESDPGLAPTPGGFPAVDTSPKRERGNSASIYSAARNSAKDSTAPLLIEFSSSDPRALDALNEDLNVMSRLLEKVLERDPSQAPDVKMGIPILVTSGSRGVRAMYVDGFGALFMAKVNIPVFAPELAKEKPVENRSDSDWESIRREISGGGDDSPVELLTYGAMSPGAAFDASQVENLKKQVLQALKNASNIRHLKGDEFVSVALLGTGAIETVKASQGRNRSNNANNAAGNNPTVTAELRGSSLARQGTVMTIRVKKAVIDAFARGKLGFEEFERLATLNRYAGAGHGTVSLNTWAAPPKTDRR